MSIIYIYNGPFRSACRSCSPVGHQQTACGRRHEGGRPVQGRRSVYICDGHYFTNTEQERNIAAQKFNLWKPNSASETKLNRYMCGVQPDDVNSKGAGFVLGCVVTKGGTGVTKKIADGLAFQRGPTGLTSASATSRAPRARPTGLTSASATSRAPRARLHVQ